MNQLELDNFVNGHQWTFAKTMAAWPHWYVVRNRCMLDAEFVQFVEHIRSNGYTKKFGRKGYTYYDHGGFSYWTMGNPIDETTIINRAKIDVQGGTNNYGMALDNLPTKTSESLVTYATEHSEP